MRAIQSKFSETALLYANSIKSSKSAVLADKSAQAPAAASSDPRKMLTLILGAFLSLFLLTGCADNPEQSISDATQEDAEQSQKGPSKQVSVIIIKPQIIAMADQLPGRVKAFKTSEIRPQVSGIVQARFFKEGSLVDKGQQLYQIDAALFEAEHQSAAAKLQNTVAELDIADALQGRYQRLIKTNAVSEQQFDNVKARLAQAKAAVALAQAEVKTAKINLDYTKVYAPISGYIGPSAFTQGALVTAQQEAALATIWQLDPVYVDISQSAAKAQPLQQTLMMGRMTQGDEAQFEVTLLLGEKHNIYPQKGVLYAADLAVDKNTDTVRLRSVFPNPNAILLPGMFVRATIAGAQTQKTILVPQKAVSIEADGSKVVWLVDNSNIASKRQVNTSSTFENNWVISSGLNSGDKVIVKGTMTLRSGAKVDPIRIKQEQLEGAEDEVTRRIRSDESVSEVATANKVSVD
ncbi:efflux RND transporter periplasmic adaptor subunit [Brumicola pallidula]|jgi:membrane fusion protein (multidrug efflux system)|uniref:Toluene efflux pump periplasmic linker protein ttgG n=2 Tax=Brumicola TaxID=3160924 RepID=K6Y827_9ALTE|nr:efflux RND transporter periplasmic adaptor subunit [Glaciecola pallidula]GAC28914.1 toluene efflux pump periplasmic linker protein ttgG [Glaciecola pallidula DSM 14239 = ACAM 615]